MQGFDGNYVLHTDMPNTWGLQGRNYVWLRLWAAEDLVEPECAGWRLSDGPMLFGHIPPQFI